jgi:argininosuccinate lyase
MSRLTTFRAPFKVKSTGKISSDIFSDPVLSSTVAEKAWSGVFSEATDRRVERFTESISFDRRLFAHDIAGSVAHAQMLAHVGLLSADECRQIEQALAAIRQEIEQNRFEFSIDAEDIHLHIERALIARLGDTGRKIHTARSRNDQVATDLRLWQREAIERIDSRLVELQRAFVGRCDADIDCILPGYTHLQRAQPVLAPHYWLAYCERLERDRGRLVDCLKRTNVLPLGSAALAGTTLAIDREFVARQLGFDAVSSNSLDATSDRDFAIEFVFALSLIALHLSGWAEEWVLWCTSEFNFLKLPQAFCTGSSIMPQKVNPDVLELVRGKTARVVGDLQSLMMLVKGLPLAYNRDMQEDKPRVFDAFDTVSACLELAAPLVAGAELNRSAIRERLDRGHLDATTLMEELIRRGIPQRTAHEWVGRLVRKALDRSVTLSELSAADFEQIDPSLDISLRESLGVDRAVSRFQSYGSTAPAEVAKQIASWKEKLKVN